jgi:hypothetical protein
MRDTLFVPALFLAFLAGCTDDNPLAEVGPIDISGTWRYSETTVMVVQAGPEITRLDCVSPEGELIIEQDGNSFTGRLTHTAGTCLTPDGAQVPPPWALPYEAELSGSLSGDLFHFDQFDLPGQPPVHCPKHGSITLSGDTAVEFRTTGLCDLSAALPFPATSTNSGVATRP